MIGLRLREIIVCKPNTFSRACVGVTPGLDNFRTILITGGALVTHRVRCVSLHHEIHAADLSQGAAGFAGLHFQQVLSWR
jgi:hypothetical protein